MVRVEYFDIPPARWANRTDIVVNIITRNPEVGYSYGVDTQGAFTTGFFNGSVYADYTKGKHNIGVEYGTNVRDYDNRVATQKYEYQLSGINYKTKRPFWLYYARYCGAIYLCRGEKSYYLAMRKGVCYIGKK